MQVFGVAGFKNAGKTELIVRLIEEFSARGVRVATIKHAHHEFDVDHPNKDSYRHRAAGASEVLLVSSRRWAHMTELEGTEEPTLDELLLKLGPVDLVLIEGYKSGNHPKLEIRRSALGHPPLPKGESGPVMIVCDELVTGESVPVFLRDDIAAVASFILEYSAKAGERDASR